MMLQPWLVVCLVVSNGAAQPAVEPPGTAADQSSPSTQAAKEVATPALAAFNKHLEDIDAAVAKVQDVRAKFEQRRQTPLLKKPMISKGDMVARGQVVRWDSKEPRRSTMVVGGPKGENGQATGDQIRIYYPEDGLVEVYETGSNEKQFMGALLPRLSALRERFDLTPLSAKDMGGSESNPHLLAVLLEPREEKLRKHLRSVQVLIDDSIPAAVKVIIVDAQGDKSEVAFTDVRINTGVKDEDMELRPPSGVRFSYPMRRAPATPSAPAASPSAPPTPPATGPKSNP